MLASEEFTTDTFQPGILILARIAENDDFDEISKCSLTADEIQNLDLTQCELVVINSCFGGDGVAKVEGLLGLGRAFLYAGAKAVLVPLTRVSDSYDTVFFIQTFYKFYLKSRSAAEALRQAIIQMIDENVSETVWAPYYVFGGL